MNKRLYKSKTDSILSGVCGGIAEYFEIDPTIVRLIWVLVSFTWGVGIIAYIICAIIIPENPYIISKPQDTNGDNSHIETNVSNKNKVLLGLVLVILGSVLLIRKFIWFDITSFWALLLIIGGIYILSKKDNKKED